jgi:hypothetical protein
MLVGDVFSDMGHFDQRRGGHGPYIEFPPTLPRIDPHAPQPPPHRGGSHNENGYYRPINKSRSYADWDDGRGMGNGVRR